MRPVRRATFIARRAWLCVALASGDWPCEPPLLPRLPIAPIPAFIPERMRRRMTMRIAILISLFAFIASSKLLTSVLHNIKSQRFHRPQTLFFK